jgi:hypothetical protein
VSIEKRSRKEANWLERDERGGWRTAAKLTDPKGEETDSKVHFTKIDEQESTKERQVLLVVDDYHLEGTNLRPKTHELSYTLEGWRPIVL